MVKIVVKTIVLIAILFVMVYLGLNNPKAIDLNFPIPGVSTKPLSLSAAFIYFGFFAVGLLAGAILTAGGGKGGGKKSGGAKDK